MKRQISTLLHLLILLAMYACGLIKTSPSPMPDSSATTNSSRLPDPDEVKAFLVQLVDVEKRAPGIVVGMIADNPQERWVVGYGRLSATDERVPDGDTVFKIASIIKVCTGTLLAQELVVDIVELRCIGQWSRWLFDLHADMTEMMIKNRTSTVWANQALVYLYLPTVEREPTLSA